MPDITYPGTFPYSTGDVAAAADVQGLVYNPSSLAASLGVINGLLDVDNVSTQVQIEAEHTQRGSHIRQQAVAGTLPLDYFDDIFGDHDGSSFDRLDLDEARVIPGTGIDFYMPWRGYVLVTWTAFWTNNSTADDRRSVVFFAFNGEYATNQYRTVGRCKNSAANPPVHEGSKCSRVWSGHYITTLNIGWNQVALKVIADADVEQTRVWARDMVVTPIRHVLPG